MKKGFLFVVSFFVVVLLSSGCSTIVPKTTPASPIYQPSHPLPVEVTSHPPIKINELAPAEVWEGLLKMGISNFYHRADTYHWDPWCTQVGTQLHKECQIVYGVLDPEDFWGYVPRDYWYREPGADPGVPTIDLKKTLVTVMKSEQLLLLTYEWVRPYYQQTFQKLTPASQQIYLEALAHAQAYLKTFDYAKELAYLKDIEAKKIEASFAHQGPYGTTIYRKLEAFIFRRVNNGDLTVEQLRHWVDILQKDFAPLAETPKG